MTEKLSDQLKAHAMSDEAPYRRGQLEPVWSRIHEHDHDIRELYKASTKAHERVNATDQALVNLRDDIREWKDQTHKDSAAILEELRSANAQSTRAAKDAAKAAGITNLLKWLIPLTFTAVGTTASILFIAYRMGVLD